VTPAAPTDLSCDDDGNVYFVSGSVHGVYCLHIGNAGSSGTSQLIAGSLNGITGQRDGIGSAALFDNPIGIVIVNRTHAYICDERNSRIRKVDLSNNNVLTFAGNSSATRGGFGTDAQFQYPFSVAYHRNSGGVLFVVDYKCPAEDFYRHN
jgi:streptogramin lyase